MLNNDTLQTIQQTAVKAQAVHVTHLFDGRKLLVSQGGEREMIDTPPGLRRHTVTRLNDILVAVERYANSGGTIWHDTEAVVLLIQDAAALDRVTLPLAHSEQFDELHKIRQGGNFDQKALVRWLRHTMHGAGVEGIIPVFRKVEFERGARGGGTIKHGDESYGRSIEEKIVSAADVPESFAVEIPVFDIADLVRPYRIELTVEIDMQNERFVITPLPDQITRAVQQAEDDIHDYLVHGLSEIEDVGSVNVFYGSP